MNSQSRSVVDLAFECNVTVTIAVSVANSGDVYVVWLSLNNTVVSVLVWFLTIFYAYN